MAKVRWGLISVRCSELRGVHFSEVRNVIVYGKINRGQVICPLYRGCPLFGGSIIRGFTVGHLRWDSSHSAEVNENINLGYSQDQGYS